MVEVDPEVLKLYRVALEFMSKFLGGAVLRDKTISRAGKTSAVIFVPSYLLGQKVMVAIAPENTEVSGLVKTIGKKSKQIQKLKKQLIKHNAELLEAGPVKETEESTKEESEEDDEAY